MSIWLFIIASPLLPDVQSLSVLNVSTIPSLQLVWDDDVHEDEFIGEDELQSELDDVARPRIWDPKIRRPIFTTRRPETATRSAPPLPTSRAGGGNDNEVNIDNNVVISNDEAAIELEAPRPFGWVPKFTPNPKLGGGDNVNAVDILNNVNIQNEEAVADDEGMSLNDDDQVFPSDLDDEAAVAEDDMAAEAPRNRHRPTTTRRPRTTTTTRRRTTTTRRPRTTTARPQRTTTTTRARTTRRAGAGNVNEVNIDNNVVISNDEAAIELESHNWRHPVPKTPAPKPKTTTKKADGGGNVNQVDIKNAVEIKNDEVAAEQGLILNDDDQVLYDSDNEVAVAEDDMAAQAPQNRPKTTTTRRPPTTTTRRPRTTTTRRPRTTTTRRPRTTTTTRRPTTTTRRPRTTTTKRRRTTTTARPRTKSSARQSGGGNVNDVDINNSVVISNDELLEGELNADIPPVAATPSKKPVDQAKPAVPLTRFPTSAPKLVKAIVSSPKPAVKG